MHIKVNVLDKRDLRFLKSIAASQNRHCVNYSCKSMSRRKYCFVTVFNYYNKIIL